MKTNHIRLYSRWDRRFRHVTAAFVFSLLMAIVAGCNKEFDEVTPGEAPGSETERVMSAPFAQVNLVASRDGFRAPHVDPALQYPWGLAFAADRSACINAMERGVALTYDERGNMFRSPVFIGNEKPTAVVANRTGSFMAPSGRRPAQYLFAGMTGRIFAWSDGMATAQIVIDRSATQAAYTGLEIVPDGGSNYLYVADFMHSRIDVFDANYRYHPERRLVDPMIPSGYSPYNIRYIGGELYVAYAALGVGGIALPGRGTGYISVFKPNGTLLRRISFRSTLNAPWGMEAHGAYLLVANHGDGRISIYERASGRFMGQLTGDDGMPVSIQGLRAIAYISSGDMEQLFFTASPGDRSDGLFGYLKRARTE